MTDTTTSQCKMCNLPPRSKDQIIELIASKATMVEISKHILNEYGTFISTSSVSRHIKNHLQIDASKVEDDPTTVERFDLNENGEGVLQTRGYRSPIDTGLISNVEEMMENAGVDPEGFDIVGDVGVSTWNSAAYDRDQGEFVTVKLYSYRIKVRAKSKGKVDLPLLWAEARKPSMIRSARQNVEKDSTLVCAFADPQIGKSGSRGGTKELIERMSIIQDKLEEKADNFSGNRAVFMDGGDIIEGFENVAAQQYTNDLSLMEQIDLASTLEFSFIRSLADRVESVDVMGVPSNHAGWRRGKDYLGKPSDDFGLFILKQIRKQFDMNETYSDRITFHFPDEWDNSLNLEINGYGLGLAHGDQANNPEGIPKWWMGQVHGNQALAKSDILVTGHFHHFRMMPSGVNRYGKSKWWLQAPTLDNGSDWYRNKSGEDSDPGMLTFEVREGVGLDISTLDIITA